MKAGQITEEEARVHPQRNCITRAVGTDRNVVSDGLIVRVKENDTIVMCSDGLNTMLEDREILDIAGNRSLAIEERVNMLIDTANNNGGKDNISAVVIDI